MRVVHTIALSLLLAVLACNRSGSQSRNATPLELAGPVETEPVENSGQKIVGTFFARVVEDQYRREAPPRDVQVKYSFDEGGGFKRERVASGRTVLAESGNYVIGTHDELVLYVESANGENLGSARAERFVITSLTEQTVELRYGSGKILLEKSPS
ncbi:MAG TPA: hypothetical protein VFV34_04035 [Blastocatellia bacterium]|nr:hypothetical protein [Blastocatellia bacterium]